MLSISGPKFTAYFDASGNKRESILTVAGFVSRIRKWERFEQEWKGILDGHSITQFHMTDFASSRGEFSSWRGQTALRRELVARLAFCIKRNINKGFAARLITRDFDDVNEEYPLLEDAGTPFALCSRTCMGMLRKWSMKKRVNINDIPVFFEDGDEDRGDFFDRAKAEGIKITPLTKPESRVFEAADLVAWKVRTAMRGALNVGSYEDALGILSSLDPIRDLLTKNGIFDARALRHLCVKGGSPKRKDVNSLGRTRK